MLGLRHKFDRDAGALAEEPQLLHPLASASAMELLEALVLSRFAQRFSRNLDRLHYAVGRWSLPKPSTSSWSATNWSFGPMGFPFTNAISIGPFWKTIGMSN